MVLSIGISVWVFLDNLTVDDQYAETVKLKIKALEQQAAQGDSASELQLGMIYHDGQEIIKNPGMASHWFKKAAEHGSIPGAYRYGMALLKGSGILLDYQEAIKWLEKSARAGNQEAQLALGNVYRYKSGIEASSKQAYLWYSLAAAQGSVEAEFARNEMETHLRPDEVIAMQEQARKIVTVYSQPTGADLGRWP